MTVRLASAALATLLLFFPPDSLSGQVGPPVGLGAHGVYATNGFDGAVGAGGRLSVSIVPGIRALGIADYYFPDCKGADSCSYWGASANVLLSGTGVPGLIRTRLGGGLAYQKRSREGAPADNPTEFDTEAVGFQMLLLAEIGLFPLVNPFVEARYEVFDEFKNQVVLSIGMGF